MKPKPSGNSRAPLCGALFLSLITLIFNAVYAGEALGWSIATEEQNVSFSFCICFAEIQHNEKTSLFPFNL